MARPIKKPHSLASAAKQLSSRVAALQFSAPVAHVYNPLVYAWKPHALYIEKFGGMGKKTIFLGMNPGPFGMMQTGVPFGEVETVTEWLKIRAQVAKPLDEHLKRPILGFECRRSEISGKRLWGLFKERYENAEHFFTDHYVVNYCPLVFLEESGRNLTPDKLLKMESKPLITACDQHLLAVIELTKPKWIVAVGKYALQCIQRVLGESEIQIICIPHPSPANPTANRDWAGQTTRIMETEGPWKDS